MVVKGSGKGGAEGMAPRYQSLTEQESQQKLPEHRHMCVLQPKLCAASAICEFY